jgi:hypothetical protein
VISRDRLSLAMVWTLKGLHKSNAENTALKISHVIFLGMIDTKLDMKLVALLPRMRKNS